MKTSRCVNNIAALLIAACAAALGTPTWAEPLSAANSSSEEEASPSSVNLRAAAAKFKAGDLDGALKLANAAAKEGSDLPPAQVIMAQFFSQARDYANMRKALAKATTDVPTDPEAFMLLGEIALRDKDLVGAESLLQKSMALLSSFDRSAKRKEVLERRTYNYMAVTAMAREDWDAARTHFETVLKLDPKNAMAGRHLALCLLRQKKETAALEQLRKVAELDPRMSIAETEMARLYQSIDDQPNVEKWLAAALAASPDDLNARLAAGQWALTHGRINEAHEHAIVALRVSRKSLPASYFRGTVAMFEKDYMTAESHFREALKRAPNNLNTSNSLALALLAQDNAEKSELAFKYAHANMQKQPDSPHAAATYAWALLRNGRLSDAVSAMQKTTALPKMDPDVAYISASINAARQHNAEARQSLESALKSTSPFMFRQDAEDLLNQLKQ